MKKMLACVLFFCGFALAQSPFDGAWMANLDTAQLSKKPRVYVLDKGMYTCASCVPKVNVKADGEDQKISGSHYYDSASVQVVDDHTVKEIDKLSGKTVLVMTRMISSDGKSLTDKFEDTSEDKPVTGEQTMMRLSKGPAGSHALSGSWRVEKISNMSSNGLTINFASTDNGLKMSDANGVSYDAKFDGKEYVTEGDPGHTMVTLKKIDANTVEETDKRDGKVVSVSRMTVSADGKSMKMVSTDKERNTTNTFTLEKQ